MRIFLQEVVGSYQIPKDYNQGPGGTGVRLAGSDEGTEGDWYWYARDETLKVSDGFIDWQDDAPDNRIRLRGSGNVQICTL
ncbi:hypothetical protein PoB_004225600 [Plakobranchus ocellatus]|uniref:C-type lectin domain-containing protein n=1 Tax=Plakobranchus ocellatus TaxID=259542 RepID=A0AAV4BAA5_9GAST|nr:hypothetical protein PoB_004225600 [Plakobranchus ocellatus]